VAKEKEEKENKKIFKKGTRVPFGNCFPQTYLVG
jgi:hypothetical protein